MEQQAFLIATHYSSESIINMYSSIYNTTKDDDITFLLYHQKNNSFPKDLKKIRTHVFTNKVLYELGYIPIRTTLTPGSNHFSLLHFYMENPNFKYYWYIEGDVRFSGSWGYLFEKFNHVDSDFISTHIESYDENPTWPWWGTLEHPDIYFSVKDRLRSFNPIYRISNTALSFIHEQLLNQWSGHHEILLPTLLYHSEFELLDFGGWGKFILPEFKNKFYTSDTFRWRPVFLKMGSQENKLYHPVKDYGM